MDKWICNKCNFMTSEQPKGKNSTCTSCGKGRYKIIKKCECGKEFHPQTYKAKYCSIECKNKFMPKGGKKGKKYPHTQRARIARCEVCGKEFRAIKDYKERLSVYCSKDCWGKRGKTIKLTCQCCGIEFEVPDNESQGNRIYCSRKCMHKKQVGENAPRFKDGKSLERQRGRDSYDLQQWRETVYKRDNYTCKKCGRKGNINAHHIKEYAKYPEFRFDVNNGITLCEECHAKEHNKAPPVKREKCCKKCNSKIKGGGKTGMCRSCSIKYWHSTRHENLTGDTAVLLENINE